MFVKRQKTYFFIFAFFISHLAIYAQVTIGSNTPPAKGSILQLKEYDVKTTETNSSKGLAMPRVSLKAMNDLSPCITDHVPGSLNNQYIGLIVYNVNIRFCEGIYVWNGLEWEPLGLCEEALYAPNCYILAPGKKLTIPITKVFAVWTYYQDVLGDFDFYGKMSADILWKDDINQPVGSGQMIKSVNLTGSGRNTLIEVQSDNLVQQGNALVVLRIGPNGNDKDPIVWSWHIWVTNYDPNIDNIPYHNGEATTIFMDRNLGALNNNPTTGKSISDSFGFQYQWGRKDPFPAASFDFEDTRPIYDKNGVLLTELDGRNSNGTGVKHASVNVDVNLKNSILNPLTIYLAGVEGAGGIYNTSAMDWYAKNIKDGNDFLWNTKNGDKGVFDPCPAGWRVPKATTGKLPILYNPKYPYDQTEVLNSSFVQQLQNYGCEYDFEGINNDCWIYAMNLFFGQYPFFKDIKNSYRFDVGMNYDHPDYKVGFWPYVRYRYTIHEWIIDGVYSSSTMYHTANPAIDPSYPNKWLSSQRFSIGTCPEDYFPYQPPYIIPFFTYGGGHRSDAASIRCVKE